MKKLGILVLLTLISIITFKTNLKLDAEMFPLEDAPYSYYEDMDFVQVALGFKHSMAINSNGEIFAWGLNSYGQLGDGSTINQSSPKDISSWFPLQYEEEVIELSLGYYHSGLLTSLGRVFTWGLNDNGQLGLGNAENKNSPQDITANFGLEIGEIITKISFQKNNSSAISSLGRVFTWGLNDFGQVGDATMLNDRNLPTDITAHFALDLNETIIDISVGYTSSIALSSSGKVFTWGRNLYGMLGDGTTELKYSPQDITSQFSLNPDEFVRFVDLGYYHAGVITSENRVFLWGYNPLGQIGDGTNTTPKLTPVEITSQFILDSNDYIEEIALGLNQSLAKTAFNRIFAWGSGSRGQLGNNSTTGSFSPMETTSYFNFDEEEEVVLLDASSDFSTWLTSKGKLYISGYNDQGQVGDGTTESKHVPTRIYGNFLTVIPTYLPRSEGIVKAYAGYSYSAAISESGQVFTWGNNNSGVLGTGNLNNEINPVNINNNFYFLPAEDKIIDLSLSTSHALALSQNGKVYAWGSNLDGAVGVGYQDDTLLPANITSKFSLQSGDKIIAIASGVNFSAALSSYGQVFTWGDNFFGQLGNDTTVSTSTPQNITNKFNLLSGEKITKINLGGRHAGALTSLNRVFTWGSSTYGQLGDGIFTSRALPMDITSYFGLTIGETILDIDFGYEHSGAITSSGRIFTWGSNNYGELGDDLYSSFKITPFEVTAGFVLMADEVFTSINFGFSSSSAITSLGRVYVWGDNYFGQLGTGMTNNYYGLPQLITGNFSLNPGETIVSLDVFADSSIAITNTGRVYSFGANNYGQLGDGTLTSSSTPIKINHLYLDEQELLLTYIEPVNNYILSILKVSIFPEYEIKREEIDWIEINSIQYSGYSVSVENGRIDVYVNNAWSLGDNFVLYVNMIVFTNNNYIQPAVNNMVVGSLGPDIYPPTIHYTEPKNIIVEKGLGDGNLLMAMAFDDTGEMADVYWDWNVDWQTPGTYEILYEAMDMHANRTEELREIIVTDYLTANQVQMGDFILNNFEPENYHPDIDLNKPFITYQGIDYYSQSYYYSYDFQLFDNRLVYSFVIDDYFLIFSKNIYYPDLISPTFDYILPQEIEVGQHSDIDWTTLIINEFDNSAGLLTKVEVEDNVIYDKTGSYEVTVKLVDESLNETTQTFVVNVIDTIPPSFDVISDQVIEINEFIDFDWKTLITNLIDNGTDELLIDVYDRTFYDELGEYVVTITVYDNFSNTYSQDFFVTVVDTTPPTFAFIEDQFLQAGDYYDWTSLIYDAFDNSNQGLIIEVYNDSVDYFTAGTYPVTVSLKDISGNETRQTFNVTVYDTIPPFFSYIEDQTIEAGDYLNFDWTTVVGYVYDNTLIELTVFIVQDDVIYNQVGEYTVILGAIDDSDNLGTISFTVTVIDTTAPTFAEIEDQTLEAGEYTDIDWTSFITDISDNSNGTFTLIEVEDNVTYNQIGSYQVTVMVKDESLNETTMSFTVNVVDTIAPEVYLMHAVDTIFVGDEYIDQGVITVDISPVNRYVSGSVDTTTAGVYTITYTVEDAGGNINVIQRIVTVLQKETQVEFTLLPALTTIKIGQEYIDGGCTVVINDSIYEVATIKETNLDTETAGIYYIVYSYTYQDIEYTYLRIVFVVNVNVYTPLVVVMWKEDEE